MTESPDWSIQVWPYLPEINSGCAKQMRNTREDGPVARDKIMQMLADHVPLTLLLDLLAPPDAHEVFSIEGGDAGWLALRRSAA